ncbi:CheB methylesterase domain-containing protein [Sulfurimonas sp.]|uniref:CheB methylesterase domain-containing protein n=1 Tax=Sulfurimonas sp. TaxID=2022749 RepID=UPI0026054418|nr:CheB methylesterase domain-containing protein [Sulfurimonas sp.]
MLIGASTGGPGHLKKIFSNLDSSINVPIVVAQHMNPVFISSFVKQFNDEMPFDFYAVDSNHGIKKGSIYICSTHCRLNILYNSVELQVDNSVNSHYNPSIDNLFKSAVKLCKTYDVLAILLTGIGSDGASGLSELQIEGANTIAESKESAIVFGMPKKAFELNSNIEVMHLNEIIKFVKKFTK